MSADDAATPATGCCERPLDDSRQEDLGAVRAGLEWGRRGGAGADEAVQGADLPTHGKRHHADDDPVHPVRLPGRAQYGDGAEGGRRVHPGQGEDRKLNIGACSPDYIFGRNSVANFLKALTDLGVNYAVVEQQWPALGAPNIAPQLSALISAKPELTFSIQFGGDLINFTNQAAGYGFFKNTRIIGMYALDPLKALGESAPSGGIAFARAPSGATRRRR